MDKKNKVADINMPSWALTIQDYNNFTPCADAHCPHPGEFKSLSSTTVNLTSFIIYGIITGAACFFISKRYPQSCVACARNL